MPALSGGMKSRWSSFSCDRAQFQYRAAFFAGKPAPTTPCACRSGLARDGARSGPKRAERNT
ncbi:hypothetical protein F3J44_02885 [Pantoea sp. Tr-811]|nr:hypothetical protein [Pantoea sp. Tr-811]